MALFGPSISERIHEAFAFLEARGYRLIAESAEAMGGSINYRSPHLWVAIDWDRSEPWLEFAPTHSSIGRVDWELVDHVLRGAKHWEFGMSPRKTASAEALAAWLRTRIEEIEMRFREPELAATSARLQAILGERRQLTEAYCQARASRPADQS